MKAIMVVSVTNPIIWSMVLVGDHSVWEHQASWPSLKEMGGTPPATRFSLGEGKGGGGGVVEREKKGKTCLNLQGLELSRISELYCYFKHKSQTIHIVHIETNLGLEGTNNMR